MEPEPLQPWVQASSRHSTSQTAGSAVATGGTTASDGANADDDDVEVVAASVSSTIHIVHFSFIIVTAADVLQLFGR